MRLGPYYWNLYRQLINKICKTGFVLLNIPEGVIFTDYVKRIKNDRCFHEEDYIHVGCVFTSGFSGRLASDKRKSCEKSCFPTRLSLVSISLYLPCLSYEKNS